MDIETEQRAHDIIKQAEARAREILDEAYEAAQVGMERTLRDTGLWVRQTRHAPNILVRGVQNLVCDQKSPGRAAMDFMLGAAKECYCCSFVRGVLYGVFGAAAVFGIMLAILR